MTAFLIDNPSAIECMRARAIRSGMEFYLKFGLRVNTAYTPRNMLAAAERITGRKYGKWTRSNALDAITDLGAWIEQADRTLGIE